MASHKALLIAAAAAMAIIVGTLLPVTAWPNNHVIGETDGWMLGVNYDYWARINDGIPVGDTLMFIYDEVFHNVVQVWDQNSYDNCIVANDALTRRSGTEIVQLGEPGKYFFFCEFDCVRGMKFAITAV